MANEFNDDYLKIDCEPHLIGDMEPINHFPGVQMWWKSIENISRPLMQNTQPETMIGLEKREAGVSLICLETALPAKFAASIEEAVGHAPPRPKGFECIEDLPRRFSVMDPDEAQIKRFIADHAMPAAGR